MMFGMVGLGWLVMLVVIGLPVLLVVLVLGGTAGFLQNRAHGSSVNLNQAPAYHSGVNPNLSAPAATRYCSHCGAGLQSDWTHCPQCGAPIQ
jgi:UPF0716 family protein affecting phage T7 exclusion